MNKKEKASFQISNDLYLKMSKFASQANMNVEEFFEKALEDYFKNEAEKHKKKEIELLNKIAVEQREEILENLEYQIDLFGDDSEE